MKRKVLCIIVAFTAIGWSSAMVGNNLQIQHLRYDTMTVKRCIDPRTGKIQTLGIVRYYTHKDTLFMDRRFSMVHVIYSNRKTGRVDTSGNGGAFVIHDNNRKGKWWYAIVSRSPELSKKDFYVSAIVLRDCHVKKEPKRHICWDAHLYNITKEIGRNKTKGKPTESIDELLKCIDGY